MPACQRQGCLNYAAQVQTFESKTLGVRRYALCDRCEEQCKRHCIRSDCQGEFVICTLVNRTTGEVMAPEGDDGASSRYCTEYCRNSLSARTSTPPVYDVAIGGYVFA